MSTVNSKNVMFLIERAMCRDYCRFYNKCITKCGRQCKHLGGSKIPVFKSLNNNDFDTVGDRRYCYEKNSIC